MSRVLAVVYACLYVRKIATGSGSATRVTNENMQ